MKVALLYPSWTTAYGIFRHFARRASLWPPLNLALLAAIAEKAGHEVVLIDGEAEDLTMEKLVQRVSSIKPDVIGLTGMSPFFHLAVQLAKEIKREHPKGIITVGGPHVTIQKEQALGPEFDFGFIGNAENSWPMFLGAMERGENDLRHIPGLIIRVGSQFVRTEGREYVEKNLDVYPIPARGLLKVDRYLMGTMRGRLNFTTIQSQRGCPWKCIFCASEELGTTRVARRSPASLVEEIKLVIRDFGIRHFSFVDDVLTLSRKNTEELCDAIIREKLNITFEGSTRANLLDEALIIKLKNAGLIRLSFGLEAVDEDMRETMKKKVPLEAYVESNRLLNKYDIECLNSIMVGLPGETMETFNKTMKFLKQSRDIKQANFAIAVPYPGTEFHQMAEAGSHGIELMSRDFSNYRRYGSAVTTVNGLTPNDLIRLQNKGFVSIYAAPWRWRPMFAKYGLIGGLLMLMRVAKVALGHLCGLALAFRIHPLLDRPTRVGRVSAHK